jgi:Cu(I)/Ag(I) efflux system membrane fusion protein
MERILIKPMSVAVAAFVLVLLTACDSEKKEAAENKADPMEAHENMDMNYATIDDSIRDSQIPTSEFVEGDTIDFSEEAPAAFKQQLNNVLAAYIGLKNALVAADRREIDNESTAMMAALLKVDDQLLKGSANAFWKEKKFFLMDHLELCKEAKDIEGKRENFAFISQAMVKAVEAYGAGQQTLYIQYCPMANDNDGAYWLSEAKEIRNPYMGKQMLTCGEVKGILN